jgi:proprotein convertase subtilisin/kexin type 5
VNGCDEGYFLTKDNRCSKYCSNYPTATKSTCATTYDCSATTGCLYCAGTGANECYRCNSNYILREDNTCQFYNIYDEGYRRTTSRNYHYACAAGCKTCTSSSPGQCTACRDTNAVMLEATLGSGKGDCMLECPENYLNIASVCIPCHSTCKTCSTVADEFACTTCPIGYLLQTDSSCLPGVCGPGTFDALGGVCQSCDLTCKTCYGGDPTNCLSCHSIPV